ncbi:MAG: mechanosensitive ion channel [Treponema sp.]|jgi:small conductance mechanosensitive channel|nr:mechanosensitive ion channel [Treponema sp.]
MLDEILSFWNNNHETVFGIARKLIVSSIVVVIGILISKGFDRLIKKVSQGKSNVNTVNSLLRYTVKYGVFIICAIMILNIFGFNTTSLIALLGAVGVAIGLALKDTMGNIASGIILFFLGCYRSGEFIEFDTFNGTVKEINLFTTILETPDGIYISAPNSSIWGSPLRNFTRNGKRRMELSVRISYFDSVDTAFGVLNDIIKSETRFLKEPAAQVIVQSMQDSHVNLVIRAWTNIQDYWDVYWQQMRNLKEKIEEAGLHIPFPQRDVHIVQDAVQAAS